MPYKAFSEGDQYCVYKLDADDNKTGDSLGCHPSKSKADEQVAALYASEGDGMNREKEAKSLFDKFWQGIKELFTEKRANEDPPEVPARAISMSRLHQAIWSQLLERDRQMGEDNYMMDIYADGDQLYALCTDRGKLYRHQLMVSGDEVMMGERVQVMESHPPTAAQMRTTVTRQTDGRYRWFSVSGTAVLNRSGEIDSRDLFDSFIAHAEATGEYPIRQFYHQGETYRTGQADFLAREGYCYITSGLYDDTPLGQAEVQARQNNPEYWGDSIGFIPTAPYELAEIADGIKLPVYRTGINTEISTLPELEAAHLFTRTEVTRMSLEGKAWEAFVKFWGGDEEKARLWLEENPQARNRAIEQAGMITRTSDDAAEFELDESAIAEITRSVLESEAVKALAGKLAEAENQLTQRTREANEVKATVADLTRRLEKLEAVEAAEQQQVVDDTPAKFRDKTRVVYRPRVAHASNGSDQANSSQVATNTLDNIGLKY